MVSKSLAVKSPTEAIAVARWAAWRLEWADEDVMKMTADLVEYQDCPDAFYSVFAKYLGKHITVSR